MILIDANVVLAVLLDEQHKYRSYCDSILTSSGHLTAVVCSEITAKMMRIQTGVARERKMQYGKIAKIDANKRNADSLLKLIDGVRVTASDDVIGALSAMVTTGLDFADCLLYYTAMTSDVNVATYDGQLTDLLGTKHAAQRVGYAINMGP